MTWFGWLLVVVLVGMFATAVHDEEVGGGRKAAAVAIVALLAGVLVVGTGTGL